MLSNLSLRCAQEKDLPQIVEILVEDKLGATREALTDPLLPSYYEAFAAIREDKNQSLLVVEYEGDVIGTCHLTFMPSLSFQGGWRLNIENVYVAHAFQGKGVGTWMLQRAIARGQEKGCKFVQLTTNKQRIRSKALYEKLGFEATHEGMKLYL